ncbi:hypothetical protein INR49_011491, partial [Caranx melampygus]
IHQILQIHQIHQILQILQILQIHQIHQILQILQILQIHQILQIPRFVQLPVSSQCVINKPDACEKHLINTSSSRSQLTSENLSFFTGHQVFVDVTCLTSLGFRSCSDVTHGVHCLLTPA